jgi:hypothetical protein
MIKHVAPIVLALLATACASLPQPTARCSLDRKTAYVKTVLGEQVMTPEESKVICADASK